MQRQEALSLMQCKLTNKNLQKHTLAVEAIMRHLAVRFDADVEEWGLAGMLHDIDYEETKADPARHSLVGGDELAALGLPTAIVDAVRAHNGYHGLPRTTMLAKALYAADPLSGLIVAAALVSPAKKLAAIDAAFVMNRFGERSFARGADRETIKCCADLGIELDDFVAIGVTAMQEVAADLGL